jgi:hypothetical protein
LLLVLFLIRKLKQKCLHSEKGFGQKAKNNIKSTNNTLLSELAATLVDFLFSFNKKKLKFHSACSISGGKAFNSIDSCTVCPFATPIDGEHHTIWRNNTTISFQSCKKRETNGTTSI